MIPHLPLATLPSSIVNAVAEKNERKNTSKREKKEAPAYYPHLSRKEEFICDAATD